MTNAKVDMRAWIERVERIEAENAELKRRLAAPPDCGPARPMETAPRDGTRILVLAEVASDYRENAINGAVIVQWDTINREWALSPYADNTHLDGEPTGWWPLPEQTR